MIRFVEHKDIVKKKWDDCVRHSVNERIYAYSWYLNIVAPEWDALVLDDYQAVFPIIHKRKMGVDYVFQPFFTQQLGLFTPLLLTPDLVESFLEELKKQYKFIQINLNIHNKLPSSYNNPCLRNNFEVYLISDHEDLKKAYSKNTKRNLKKAQKAGLTIFKNLKPELVGEVFKKNRGKGLAVYSSDDYHILNRLIYKGIEKGKAEVWGAFSKENNLIASAIFVKDSRRFTFLFSGNTEEGKEKGAMFYLLDSFIEAQSGTKMIMDFEGSMDPNLARFYKSFGAQLIRYPHIYHNKLPFYINLSLKTKSILNNLIPASLKL
jgi:hypothetical protein